jgi:uncharacterized protein (TIGR02271 family)
MAERERNELTRHEEELAVSTQITTVGAIHARKRVEVEKVAHVFPRRVEHADIDHVAANEGDSGQIETLPDGSISIPVLEEELVVSKRTVVRERIVIRKETITEEQRIEADLRSERVEVDVEEQGAA